MVYDATDYKRLPKNSPRYNTRRYVNIHTGREISRWEYQTLKAGGMSPREVAKVRRVMRTKSRGGESQRLTNALIKKYKIEQARIRGVKPSQVRVRGDSEAAVLFRSQVVQLKKLNAKGAADKSARGALAKLLTDLGFRRPEWDMPVGQSPREEG